MFTNDFFNVSSTGQPVASSGSTVGGGGLTEAQVDARIDTKAATLTVDNANKLGGNVASSYATTTGVDTSITNTVDKAFVDKLGINASSLGGTAASGYLTTSSATNTYLTKSDASANYATTATAGLNQTQVDARIDALVTSTKIDGLGYSGVNRVSVNPTVTTVNLSDLQVNHLYVLTQNLTVTIEGAKLSLWAPNKWYTFFLPHSTGSPRQITFVGGGFNFQGPLTSTTTNTTGSLIVGLLFSKTHQLSGNTININSAETPATVIGQGAYQNNFLVQCVPIAPILSSLTTTNVNDLIDTKLQSSTLTVNNADKLGDTLASAYLKTADASSTYLTQSNATSTYLTQSAAGSTYATISSIPTFRQIVNSTSSGLTLGSSHINRFVNHSGGGSLTLPSVTWNTGEEVEVYNSGANALSVTAPSGVTLRVITTGQTAIKSSGVVVIKCISSNTYLMIGQIQTP